MAGVLQRCGDDNGTVGFGLGSCTGIKVVASLKKRNKEERAGQGLLPLGAPTDLYDVREAVGALEAAPDSTAAALAEKERRWAELLASEPWKHAKLVHDTWCAAFLWPKQKAGPLTEVAPTTAVWRSLRDGKTSPTRLLAETIESLARESALFHWELAFPMVFDRGGFDVVLGNPPYLSQLSSDTAVSRGCAAMLRHASSGIISGYADVAAAFLNVHSHNLRSDGAICFIVPQSFLVDSDSRAIRQDLAMRLKLTSLWVSNERVFADASVYTCAPCFQRIDGDVGGISRVIGARAERLVDLQINRDELASYDTWALLYADSLGTPLFSVDTNPRLGTWADSTADFRDQYYGLRGYLVDQTVADDANFPPIVTTGLIDPARCDWGRQTTRILKEKWHAPRIDVRRMTDTGTLAQWIASRRVPKVLLATQGKVLEVYCDVDGRFVPSVPLISLLPKSGVDIWSLAAAASSPVACAWAAARFAGAALAIDALRLSASQVGDLPLPIETNNSWRLAVAHFRSAHSCDTHQARTELLTAFAERACSCYGLDSSTIQRVFTWWIQRLPTMTRDLEEDQ